MFKLVKLVLIAAAVGMIVANRRAIMAFAKGESMPEASERKGRGMRREKAKA